MNILDAVGQAGIVLRRAGQNGRSGNEFWGPCPGCRAGKDRFHVWPDKGDGGTYWCRQCGAKGDLVQFLKDYCGYTYPQAFEAVGRAMPEKYTPAMCRPAGFSAPSEFQPLHHDDPVETWQIRAGALVEEACSALLGFDRGMEWLAGRGIDEGAVRHFRLGWFAGENGKPCMYRPRSAWGLPDVLKDNGRKKMLWIPRGFVIPCFRGGAVHRIRIRRPSGDLKSEKDIRYYMVPGSGNDLLWINSDKQAQVVVESELDAMMVAAKAGALVGVGALGSASNKPGASVFYDLKKALRILVALDYDAAGLKAWEWWSKEFDQARQWPVPAAKDPGEAFAEGVDIQAWIYQGLPAALTMDLQPDGYVPPDGLSHMEELKFLLTSYPVTILARVDRAEIMFDPGFKNRAIRHRIRQLFEYDDEVHWYLRMYHPDDVITGENCEVKAEHVTG